MTAPITYQSSGAYWPKNPVRDEAEAAEAAKKAVQEGLSFLPKTAARTVGHASESEATETTKKPLV